MNEKDFQLKLIQRYIENKCTDEELEIFFHLIENDQINDVLIQKMDLLMDAEDAVASPAIPKIKKDFYPFSRILKVVATITIIVAAGTYAFYKPNFDWTNLPDCLFRESLSHGNKKDLVFLVPATEFSTAILPLATAISIVLR